ncbi:fimbrillin family protein [Bacteroides nordii]|uniref:Fimbrillin family protein n=1 Tax=Bacteroides nordii TaxID=291645 RepID=A0A413VIG9_9BACE|nr:fimbrillin family protein [Bacteroides nordii]RHB33365.1 fimbrillin family protein [Bacteroides nordii]
MKKLLITMTFAVLLAGCSEEASVPGGNSVQERNPLTVQSASLNTDVQTRAATTPVTSGSIGLFLANNTSYPDAYVPVDNNQYSHGTPWTSSNPIYLGGETADVCAYYPYSADRNNSKAFTLKTQTYNAPADLCYSENIAMNGAKATADGAGTIGCKVSFTLKRAYSKVAFEFYRKNYPGTCEMTHIQLKNCITDNTLDITSGTYGTVATTGDLDYDVKITVPEDDGTSPTPSITTSDDDADAKNLLVIPGDIPGADLTGVTIVLTVDGKTMTTKIPRATLGKFVAGKVYTFKMSVNGTSTEVEQIDIEDWISEDVTDSGDKPFVPLP